MFYGEYEHSLDPKGRIIIPAKVREVLRKHDIDTLYVTRGLDTCLFLFTKEGWITQEQKFKEMPFTRKESRKFNRLFFSGACEVSFDKQGRILLPQYLKDYAGITNQVMINGVSDRLEIWALDKWKKYFDDAVGSFEEIADSLLDN